MSENGEFESISIVLFEESEEEGSQNSAKIVSKPIPIRSRSLSYSAPISTDVYRVIPQSPATTFLSEFLVSHRDDTFGPEGFEEGRVVGNYLVGPLIGGGGFGQCRQAYVINRNFRSDSSLPEKVVLKIITDPRCFRDFDVEVSIWSRLRHPNILPLLDFCVGPNYKIAVSPLIEGGTLQKYLAENGRFDEEDARAIFRNICYGMQYMHNECRIAHLDIKLENILLTNTPDCCVICDFGLSSAEDDNRKDTNNPSDFESFCSGSVASLPPEVLSSEASNASDFGSFEQKKKQDIWALGVLLYAMVCGRLPFYDQFMPRLQHSIIMGSYEAPSEDLSPEVIRLINSLLNTRPQERPDINELINHEWFSVNCKKGSNGMNKQTQSTP